jgi:2-polyprenyl-6-methoxyphenol hydroxylase-like FAD-dependent oxidoreductase
VRRRHYCIVHSCDVLVVGAGPTGLTLTAFLQRWGVSVRIVDRNVDRVAESRALAVQPRTLELLQALGLADMLIGRGNPATQLRIHGAGRVAKAQLFDIGVSDTRFPFLLFVSQAETEAVLEEALAAAGCPVERGVELVSYEQSDSGVVCSLRHPDGELEQVRARYVAGCDGMNSSVRTTEGIDFLGSRYPQTFLLADLEVDGLEAGTVNACLSAAGPLLFFPLHRPAPWRVIAMRSDSGRGDDTQAVLGELQQLADTASDGRLTLHDPAWTSVFRLHHRAARQYRRGRAFLAGDAAHVHSPVGAQGMNTGMQDAVNLAWKLGLVCRDQAHPSLLASYDAERRPVGEYVLQFTDRAFSMATSRRRGARLVRARVAPRLLPLALRLQYGRAIAFRTVSQLGVRYRSSPAVQSDGGPRQRSPRPGDRLADAPVIVDGRSSWLQTELAAPAFHLVLCGPDRWDSAAVMALAERYPGVLKVARLDRAPTRGVLYTPDGVALRRLRVTNSTTLLVRPDGYLATRTDDAVLDDARRYLQTWLG